MNNYFVHIKEIRNRIIFNITYFLLSFILCYCFRNKLFAILLLPYQKFTSTKIITTTITEKITISFKASFFFSLLTSIPITIFNIYFFLKPALNISQNKVIFFTILLSITLMCLGLIISYYFILPQAFILFSKFQISSIKIDSYIKISEYFNFTTKILFTFAIIFQIPLIILILVTTKIIKIDVLKKYRKISILINFIIAGIITPPDIYSQIILAIIMIIIYELSIFLCIKIKKIVYVKKI